MPQNVTLFLDDCNKSHYLDKMFTKLWHKITGHRKENPTQSYRASAGELGIAKSTIHDHDKRLENRAQYPESEFWNSKAGQDFLKRLIVGTIYTFGIKGGIGAGRIEEFMKLIRINTHAGVSQSSIYRVMKEIEVEILKYKELQEQELEQRAMEQKEYLEIVLGADETWLDEMLLVCQELSSGYLFLSRQARKEVRNNGIHRSGPLSRNLD